MRSEVLVFTAVYHSTQCKSTPGGRSVNKAVVWVLDEYGFLFETVPPIDPFDLILGDNILL